MESAAPSGNIIPLPPMNDTKNRGAPAVVCRPELMQSTALEGL